MDRFCEVASVKEKVSESAHPWLAPELDKQFFNESGVRAYMDNLFLEGYIQPITVSNLDRKTLDIPSNKWLKVGIFIDPDIDYRQRLDGLIASLDNSLPDSEARYKDWLNFARRWGELVVLRYQTDLSKLSNLNSDELSYEETPPEFTR
jgi:acyl-homoserine lactone acylase PvdQ